MKSFGILILSSLAIAGCGRIGVLSTDITSIEFPLNAATPRPRPCWASDQEELDAPAAISRARSHAGGWPHWRRGYAANRRLISVKRYSDGTAKLAFFDRDHRDDRPGRPDTRCSGTRGR